MNDAVKTKPRKSRSGSETRQRSGIVGFRALPGERDLLDVAAERAGLTLSSYIRACVLDAPKTRATRRPTIERELMSQAVARLGRAIGSLHQIAKQLNFGNREWAEGVPAAVAECRAAVAAIMEAAGQPPRPAQDAHPSPEPRIVPVAEREDAA